MKFLSSFVFALAFGLSANAEWDYYVLENPFDGDSVASVVDGETITGDFIYLSF